MQMFNSLKHSENKKMPKSSVTTWGHWAFCKREMLKSSKNRWKLMKIVILKEKFFISSEQVERFQWNFQERCEL